MTDLKFNLFKDLQTNDDLETGGKWVWPYGPEKMGCPGFKLARMGGKNMKYENTIRDSLRDYQRLLSAKKLDKHTIELVKEKTKEAFFAVCLLDWKQVNNAAGEPIQFSKQNAADLCEQIPQVYEDLLGHAMDLKTFQIDEAEVDAGN